MSGLVICLLGLALLMFVVGVAGLGSRETTVKVLLSVPRNMWLGRILAVVCLLWSAWLLKDAPLFMQVVSRFCSPVTALYVLTPIAGFLVLRYLDELLAARALGGIMLLVPTPLIVGAREVDTWWRYVILVVGYAMVIKGVVLVLSPFMLRKGCEFWNKSTARWYSMCLVALGWGVFFGALALLAGRQLS